MSDFFDNLARMLRLAADEDAEEEDLPEELSPEDEVIQDKELADEQSSSDEDLPPLGEGEEILDMESEEPFGPALSPSLWEQTVGQDGLIVFQKTDSESDPEATKGRYTRKMHMDVGEPDDAVVDYINAFLVHNKLRTTPLKHMTMRTPHGPSSVDEYDNGVIVSRKWQEGKFSVHIQWQSSKITVPPVFKKEVSLPDELKSTEAPEESGDELGGDLGGDEIPSLDDIDDALAEPGEETPGEEIPEETPEETPEEEAPAEEKEEEASLSPYMKRLSKRIFAANDDVEDLEAELGKELGAELEKDKEEPEEEEPKEDKKLAEPKSKDSVKDVHEVLDAKTESGKTVFEEFMEMAVSNQWLYPRDFKDIESFREKGQLDKLRQKEEAMANAILGRLKGVIKQKQKELAAFSLSKRVYAEIGMPDSELIKLIADRIESVSASPLGKSLISDLRPEDIAEVPEEAEAPAENKKSASERLVEEFFEEKGEMPNAVRQKTNDIDLLNKIRERLTKSEEFDEVTDEDFAKAKKMIAYHQQGTGDLTGTK